MKKILFLLAMLLILSGMACAHAQEEYASGDFQYILREDGTAEITDYTGNSALEIPEQLDGISVTAISDGAFSLAPTLAELSIPDGVVSVGANPFTGCQRLKRIVVSPDHPTLAAIDGVLFDKAEKKLICCPPAFAAESYEIPQGILAIGDTAFSGCDSLKEITIPDSVTSAGSNPFRGCGQLSKINVSPDQPALATIDGVLFLKAEKKLICYPSALAAESYAVPQGIIAIGDDAFYSNDALRAITLPDSVTAIGDRAFCFCTALSEIALPEGVTAIGDYAFSNCTALVRVTLPEGVTVIGDGAFSICCVLSEIALPGSLTTIGEGAFIGVALREIALPEGLTSIGSRAFSGCDTLSAAVVPDSVTEIGGEAFSDCSSLTLTVGRESYALEYARENDIPYTYPDVNDWLNS